MEGDVLGVGMLVLHQRPGQGRPVEAVGGHGAEHFALGLGPVTADHFVAFGLVGDGIDEDTVAMPVDVDQVVLGGPVPLLEAQVGFVPGDAVVRLGVADAAAVFVPAAERASILKER